MFLSFAPFESFGTPMAGCTGQELWGGKVSGAYSFVVGIEAVCLMLLHAMPPPHGWSWRWVRQFGLVYRASHLRLRYWTIWSSFCMYFIILPGLSIPVYSRLSWDKWVGLREPWRLKCFQMIYYVSWVRFAAGGSLLLGSFWVCFYDPVIWGCCWLIFDVHGFCMFIKR